MSPGSQWGTSAASTTNPAPAAPPIHRARRPASGATRSRPSPTAMFAAAAAMTVFWMPMARMSRNPVAIDPAIVPTVLAP